MHETSLEDIMTQDKKMKKILLRLTAMGILSLILAFFFLACGETDDDDDTVDDDDDTVDDDDDIVDDDDDDNDTGDDDDDDTGDDDDDDLHPPEISDAQWDPNPVSWDDELETWISYINFSLKDVENDLLGGAIYVYLHNTTELIWENPIFWESGIPDVVEMAYIAILNIFAETAAPPGWNIDYCVDLEVSDGVGLFSNKIENFCVYVP